MKPRLFAEQSRARESDKSVWCEAANRGRLRPHDPEYLRPSTQMVRNCNLIRQTFTLTR